MCRVHCSVPVTPKNPVVDEYHGVKVVDNYRWLEDPDSEPTQQWVAAQNQVTNAYLNELKSERAAISARLKETFNYERYGKAHIQIATDERERETGQEQ
jgi:prolyl oligopeptidase